MQPLQSGLSLPNNDNRAQTGVGRVVDGNLTGQERIKTGLGDALVNRSINSVTQRPTPSTDQPPTTSRTFLVDLPQPVTIDANWMATTPASEYQMFLDPMDLSSSAKSYNEPDMWAETQNLQPLSVAIHSSHPHISMNQFPGHFTNTSSIPALSALSDQETPSHMFVSDPTEAVANFVAVHGLHHSAEEVAALGWNNPLDFVSDMVNSSQKRLDNYMQLASASTLPVVTENPPGITTEAQLFGFKSSHSALIDGRSRSVPSSPEGHAHQLSDGHFGFTLDGGIGHGSKQAQLQQPPSMSRAPSLTSSRSSMLSTCELAPGILVQPFALGQPATPSRSRANTAAPSSHPRKWSLSGPSNFDTTVLEPERKKLESSRIPRSSRKATRGAAQALKPLSLVQPDDARVQPGPATAPLTPAFAGKVAIPAAISAVHPTKQVPTAEERFRRQDEELLRIDFDDVTVTHLKELLRERGLPSAGRKAILVERVQDLIRINRLREEGLLPPKDDPRHPAYVPPTPCAAGSDSDPERPVSAHSDESRASPGAPPLPHRGGLRLAVASTPGRRSLTPISAAAAAALATAAAHAKRGGGAVPVMPAARQRQRAVSSAARGLTLVPPVGGDSFAPPSPLSALAWASESPVDRPPLSAPPLPPPSAGMFLTFRRGSLAPSAAPAFSLLCSTPSGLPAAGILLPSPEDQPAAAGFVNLQDPFVLGGAGALPFLGTSVVGFTNGGPDFAQNSASVQELTVELEDLEIPEGRHREILDAFRF